MYWLSSPQRLPLDISVKIIVSGWGTMGRDKSFSYPVIPRAPFFFSLSPASLRQKKRGLCGGERAVSVCIFITKGNHITVELILVNDKKIAPFPNLNQYSAKLICCQKCHRLNIGLTQAKIDVETHSVYCSYVNINLL